MSEEHEGEEPANPEADEGSRDSGIDASDRRSVERASRRASIWKAQRREFWRACLDTEIGRRAIWEFLTLECNFGNVPIANSPAGFPDAQGTMFWLGCNRVGDRLYKMLDIANPDGVRLMRIEYDPEYAEARPRRRNP